MNCGCLMSILCNTSECQSAALRRKTHTGRADQPSPRDRRQSPQRADPMGTNGQHAQQPRDPKDNRGTSPQQLPTDHQAHTITKGTKPQQDQTRRIGDHSGCHSPERACGHAGMQGYFSDHAARNSRITEEHFRGRVSPRSRESFQGGVRPH
jgi:hypothetical protein